MKIKPIVENGKVTGVAPSELTDEEKICVALRKIINENKQEKIGKEHLGLIDSSLKIKRHDKNPLGQGKKNMYGYIMYAHNADVSFEMHKDYNIQNNKDWGSHKIIKATATLSFHDTEDQSLGNIQDVKIIQHKLNRSDM